MEIILFGNKKDCEMSDFLLKQLYKHYQFKYCIDAFKEEPKDNTLIICETDKLKKVDDKDYIIIIKNKANISHIKIRQKPICIINSGNIKQLKKLSKYDYPVIACGMANKDSVTFSSIGSENSVISVQRSLELFNNHIEPMEIPVTHKPEHGPYSMLCYAIIALALEPNNEEISFKFE